MKAEKAIEKLRKIDSKIWDLNEEVLDILDRVDLLHEYNDGFTELVYDYSTDINTLVDKLNQRENGKVYQEFGIDDINQFLNREVIYDSGATGIIEFAGISKVIINVTYPDLEHLSTVSYSDLLSRWKFNDGSRCGKRV